uniref:Secreted protein n=1 Tax=Meloidogyne incognita TaxID=6306 RepID=A0A914LDP6_MELIC
MPFYSSVILQGAILLEAAIQLEAAIIFFNDLLSTSLFNRIPTSVQPNRCLITAINSVTIMFIHTELSNIH